MGEAVSVGVTDVQVEAIEAPRGGTPSVPTLNHFLTFKYVQRFNDRSMHIWTHVNEWTNVYKCYVLNSVYRRYVDLAFVCFCLIVDLDFFNHPAPT